MPSTFVPSSINGKQIEVYPIHIYGDGEREREREKREREGERSTHRLRASMTNNFFRMSPGSELSSRGHGSRQCHPCARSRIFLHSSLHPAQESEFVRRPVSLFSVAVLDGGNGKRSPRDRRDEKESVCACTFRVSLVCIVRAQVESKEDMETQKMPRSFFPIYPRTIVSVRSFFSSSPLPLFLSK